MAIKKDFNYLAVRMHQIANGITKSVNQITQEAARNAHYELLTHTPVDVGTARSNWIVRLGAPFQFVYKAYSPFVSRTKGGAGGSLGEGSNLGAAVAQGKAVIARRKGDEPIYITNNLPYIVPLNKGHSKQIAAGFVKRAVQSATAQAASKALVILRLNIR